MERKLKPYPMPVSQTEAESSEPSEAGYQLPHYPVHKRPNRSMMKWIIPVVVLVLVIIVGGLIFHLQQKVSPKHNTDAKHTVVPAQNLSGQNTNSQYVSNGQDLNLSFSYPSDWSVNPATNDNPTDQTITVTSPLTSITNASNTTITGKVVVM